MARLAYAELIKLVPYESEEWEGFISVAFGKAHDGWIMFWVACTPLNQHVTIHASNVDDPFPKMVMWLEAISKDNLPAEIEIDEEGQVKTMRVDRIEGQPSKVNFSVIDALEWDKDKQTILRAKLEKNQLIAEFVRKLEDYQKHDFVPMQWFEEETQLIPDLSMFHSYLNELG